MRKRTPCALLCLAMTCGSVLGGCGSTEPPAPPPGPQGTVVDPLLQQMDRARQQAAEMEQRKQQLDSALDAQER